MVKQGSAEGTEGGLLVLRVGGWKFLHLKVSSQVKGLHLIGDDQDLERF